MATHAHSNILAWRILLMDRGTWRATIHGVAESDMTEQLRTTQLYISYISPLYVILYKYFPKFLFFFFYFSSVQFSSVAPSYPTLCDPMNHTTPGLPVHHQLPEFTQTHVHRVSDAIQPSHPLSSPSTPAPNPSQHQNLFQ